MFIPIISNFNVDMYCIYTVDELAEEPIMLIDRHIGMDSEEGMGIMGDMFARELMQLDGMGKKRIQIWINSVGGNVMDAMAIYNAILKSKTKVDTYNVGVCASSAGLIFQAGRNRIMNDYALFMMHNPYSPDATADADMLQSFSESTAAMISARCGKPVEEVTALMNATTWMSASECKDNCMCDEIASSNDFNKKRMATANGDVKASWKSAGLILNSVIENQKTKKMDKVLNALKLNTAANEDAIMEAITGIQNKLTEKEAAITEVQNKLTAKEAELLEVQNKVAGFEATAKAAETEAKAVKAKAFVDVLAKAGKIKAEAIAEWEKKATEDLEGTEKLAEGLTANKDAAKITIENTVKPALSIAAKMAELREKNNI